MIPNPVEDGMAPVGPALRDAKRTLRERILAARDALSPAERAAAAIAIAARIGELPSYASAGTVLLTLAFRSEWDTVPLARAALAAGKTVVVPRVDALARMLELRVIRDPVADVETGYQGIPEPRLDCPIVTPGAIDWALVPGVAFDAFGSRMGYGGGFYDRLLPLVPASAKRVAGAYDLQLVAQVPAAPHDLAVDAIVTPTRTIVPAAR